MTQAALPWLAIFPAVALLWIGCWRQPAFGLLVLGYALAFVVGQLEPLALVTIGLLMVTAAAVQPQRPKAARMLGFVVFVGLALGLRAHVMPGFNNPLVLDAQVSAAAAPHRMYLNLDKLLIAIWILYGWGQVEWSRVVRHWTATGIGAGAATAAVVVSAGVLIGVVAWDPKWPPAAWIWALNNLMMVSFVEEAFFRGFIQGGLTRVWAQRRYGAEAALTTGAILFGLAHHTSGPAMVVLAAVSGIGYGLAYRRAGLQAAVLAHAVLNLVHFAGFTYPMIAR